MESLFPALGRALVALEITRPANPCRFLGEQLLNGGSVPTRRNTSAVAANVNIFELFDSGIAPGLRDAMARVFWSGLAGEDAVRELGALLLETGGAANAERENRAAE